MNRRRKLTALAAALLVTGALAGLVGVAHAGEAAAARQEPTPTAPHKPSLTPAALPTPLALPTFTPRPAALATGTTSPTDAALPLLAPLPADVNPLTGLAMADAARLDRRPLLVKISNYPPEVRPQYGINRADHVWEHVVEGGGTRFTAVYLSEDIARIGSVRSARLVDLYLTPMYRGLLAYSGSSIGMLQRLQMQPWFGDYTFSLEEGDDCPMFCRYDMEGVQFWHTMFVSAPAIRERAAALRVDERVDLRGLTFSAEPPAGGTAAINIDVRYPGTNGFWFYSAAARKYFRWTEGERHLDSLGDVQVAYTNVVLIYANHVEDPDVAEDEIGSVNYAMDIQLLSDGPAVILRDGQRFDGRWVRPAPEGMMRLLDVEGRDIPLSPGTVWFHLLPLDHTALTVSS